MSFTLSAGKLLFELWSKRLLRCTFIAVAMGSIFLILHFNFRGGLNPTAGLGERAGLANAETYHPATPTFVDPDPSDIASFGMVACAAVAIAASITVLIKSSRRKPWVRASRSPPLSQAKKVSATPTSRIISFEGTTKNSEVVSSTQCNSCPSGRPSTGLGSTRSAVDRVSPRLGIDSNRSTSTISNGCFSSQDSPLGIMKEAERREATAKEKDDKPIAHPPKNALRPTAPSFVPRDLLCFPKTQVVRISPVTFSQLQDVSEIFKDSPAVDICVGSDIKSTPQPSVQKTQAAAPYMAPQTHRFAFGEYQQHVPNPPKPQGPPHRPSSQTHQQPDSLRQSKPQQRHPASAPSKRFLPIQATLKEPPPYLSLAPSGSRMSPSPISLSKNSSPAAALKCPPPNITNPPLLNRSSRWGPPKNPPEVSIHPPMVHALSPASALLAVPNLRPNAIKILSPLPGRRARGRAARMRKWAEAMAATLDVVSETHPLWAPFPIWVPSLKSLGIFQRHQRTFVFANFSAVMSYYAQLHSFATSATQTSLNQQITLTFHSHRDTPTIPYYQPKFILHHPTTSTCQPEVPEILSKWL